MPPLLAAALCAGFIYLLFNRNAKYGLPVSRAIWIPTLWVAIVGSKQVASWINLSGGDSDVMTANLEGDAANRNVLVGFIVTGLIVLHRRRFSWGDFCSKNGWLVVMFLFTLISTSWSEYPFVAFKRWIRIFGCLVMVMMILTEKNPVEAVRQVFVRCTYLLMPLSILTIKYFLEIGVYYDQWTGEPGYCGVTTDKNALGRLAWLSTLFLIWSIDSQGGLSWFQKIKRRWWDLLVMALCVMLLKKSNSATSLFCLIVTTGVYFTVRTRWMRASPKLMAVGASVLILLSFLFLGTPALRKAVTESLGRKPNLTDRTLIWDQAMEIKINPIVGEGFASFWLIPEGIALRERLKAHEAHNGYLETYLNLGYVGATLLFIVLLCAGRNTLKYIKTAPELGVLYGALFIGVIFYNYTETAIVDSSLVGYLVWQLATWYPFPVESTPAGSPADEMPIEDYAELPGPKSSNGGQTG